MIRDVTLIDGRGGPPLPNTTIIIANGRIAALGPANSLEIPRGARVVEGAGQFLIPGMWDMHTHVTIEGASSLGMYLANGVTSVRDMGGSIDTIRAWRADIAAGRRAGPRIVAAGPQLESRESVRQMRLASSDTTVTPSNRVVVPDSTSAQRIVDSIAALGVDFVKIRTYENPATYWAIARAVRRRGLTLVGHPPWGVDEVAVADSGQKSAEHGYFPWKLDSMPEDRRHQVLDAFRRNHVAQVPTLIAWHPRRFSPDSVRAAVDGPIAQRHRWRSALSPGLLEYWHTEVVRFAHANRGKSATPQQLAEWNANLDGMAHDMAEMHQAGIMVMPGSDMPVSEYPGEGLHAELELFVSKHIMSAQEAVESASRNPAQFLGLADSLGTIARGKIADLVLLDADPTIDIRNARRIRAVVQGGSYYDRTALKQMVTAHPPARRR